jgi:hypothetical protein
MPAIPFPISSAPGVKGQEGSGRLINCYAEKLEPGGRFPLIWRRDAGLRQQIEIPSYSHMRGGIVSASTLVVVLNQRVQAVTVSSSVFSAVDLGALAGTLPVTTAVNNNASPQIVCVSENGAFNLFTGSAPTAYADANLPQPNSVSMLDGYFLYTIGDGRIFASALNAVTQATNSYTTEQGLALRRGVAFRGEFYAFGDKWCGVYNDAGTSPFPLSRRFTIPRGIAGTHAIAGWEPGWANTLIWVGDDLRVYHLNGYVPEAISSSYVERAIASAADPTLLEATVFMAGGNPFWVLTNPGVWTWVYNVKTQNWTEKQSWGRPDWTGTHGVRAFNKWVVGNRADGKISTIDESYYKENNNPLVMTIESGAVAAFPSRGAAPRADFDITAAVGLSPGENPMQTQPRASISWSKDGGYYYGNPVLRNIGAEGVSNNVVSVLRLGKQGSKGFRFRVSVSDAVHVGFMGGTVAIEQRAE